jgi:hypothetical protein
MAENILKKFVQKKNQEKCKELPPRNKFKFHPIFTK